MQRGKEGYADIDRETDREGGFTDIDREGGVYRHR